MPEHSAGGPAAGPEDAHGATASGGGPASGAGGAHGATASADGTGGRYGRAAGDRKWPLPVRLLVAAALLPVGAAVILAAQNAFTSAIGVFFGPLMVSLMGVTVIVVWLATGRGQR